MCELFQAVLRMRVSLKVSVICELSLLSVMPVRIGLGLSWQYLK